MEHTIAVAELHNRMEEMSIQINKFSGPTGADLRRLFKVAVDLRDSCSKELVVCRRIGKPTSKYLELYAELNTTMENLDSYLVMVLLSRP